MCVRACCAFLNESFPMICIVCCMSVCGALMFDVTTR